MTEEWKIITEFPTYSVSNFGRVRNNTTGYILYGGYDKDKYRQVTICYNNKQYNRRICRLVAKAFLPNPNNLPQVNHKDENKENDFANNLEWCSSKYNNNYGTRTQKTRRPIMCIETGKIYDAIKFAVNEMKVSYTTIRVACLNPNRTAAGLHWKYV